jgi:NAD(P)-dependent dehydrogenase (short-subunit alcohol dehydrogenase family)
VVLITGASSGIGAATAQRLAAAGATVLMVARREDLLIDVAATLPPGSGGRMLPHPADLTDSGQVGDLVETVLQTYGGVDIVISNAGHSIRRPLSRSYDRLHDFSRTMAINYTGPVQLILGLLPGMRARRSGHLINISTVGIDLPSPRWSAYTASKGAFETWFQCMAPEARADGVRSTSVHFSLVRTPMSAPTRHLHRLPAMSAEEAAGVVCRAVVDQPRMLRPWWAAMGAISGQAAPGLTDTVQTLLYRGSRAQARLSRAATHAGGPARRSQGS